MNKKTILITGAAGFIGSNLCLKIFENYENIHIIGIDNMNAYYDVNIKKWRLSEIERAAEKAGVNGSEWNFIEGNIADKNCIDKLFATYKPDIVVNLAAQAGVRYSITNPDAYIESNLIGFYNILEACRHSYDNAQSGVQHLVYARSSSVYGYNNPVQTSPQDKDENQVSIYAWTTKSHELMAHTYS